MTARDNPGHGGERGRGKGPDLTLTVGAGGPAIDAEVLRSFELEIIEGADTGRRWRSQGRTCSIGSAEGCDLVLRDPTVSRLHCELSVDDERVRIRDTGSRNGTLVDGVRVVDAFLRGGSVLRLGRLALKFDYGIESNALRVSSRKQFGILRGDSLPMRQVFAILERAAASQATTLIEGETGTGKSAAARSIHMESERRDGPFVILDCGAVPANLLESELFGHERGAFTGADTRRVGAFEEASGGTLFLDEIGELPLDLQPKLLGVLENREVRRLGSNKVVPVDVRVIAATNRDLCAAVNDGSFRSDLYFRVAVIRLQIPPLRARRGEILPIARKLLADLGLDEAAIERFLSPALITQLQRSNWPGNVRELKNYLERCHVFEEALPVDTMAPRGEVGAVDTSLPFADARQRLLNHFERDYLSSILAEHEGKVVDAAAAAAVDRTHFYRLLRKHGLNR
ncbi:sigma 54-interacting transcriptional regulator [Haliangium ochraceum]|uniref:FHA domain containing protein n=1 Tax=Haliangium ochraceum (strain DSM 14365 / JCM 11303 / SMP-2) TaxID=502025 RepID=D0LXU7_HALO1|nr:sigma 54-interacting transcriptional regulator [Haliangium ochraceum]ACY14302.1 FHA domain containing protein [Haliangium ochraceum DSM 14365]